MMRPGRVSADACSRLRASPINSAAVTSALPRWVPAEVSLAVLNRSRQRVCRCAPSARAQSSKETSVLICRSKPRSETCRAERSSVASLPAISTASLHNAPRCMLALVSINTATISPDSPLSAASGGRLKNGRANAAASSIKSRQRSASNRRCSSRVRRFTLGGVGLRNINELKSWRLRMRCRTRWKMMGSARAATPARNQGERKFMRRSFAGRCGG